MILKCDTKLKRLIKNRPAFFSLLIISILYILSIFAPFVSPYDFDEEDRSLSYAPPTKIYLFDGFKIKPYFYKLNYRFDEFNRKIYYEDKSKKYFIKFFKRANPYRILFFKSDIHLFGADEKIYLLGADYRGRDIFSRIIYGSRVSLSIGLIGIFFTFFIGVFIGAISGYFGGFLDNLIMRLCEIIMVIPSFYLLLSLRSIFSYSLTSIQIYFIIVIIMSLINWAPIARVIRGMALSLKEKEFVLASKALGSSDIKIILNHIIPHTYPYLITSLTLSIPSYILGESALSMLGLGIQEPYVSWGNLLSEAMSIMQIKFHPWILFPGFFIFLAVFAFNVLGQSLRDIFDPKTY